LLLTIAVLGFYFFQMPQIEHLAATRAAAEKQHVDTAIAAYLNMKDANDKKTYLAHLKRQYPDQIALATVQQSVTTVASQPDFTSNTSPKARCAELDRLLTELQTSESDLTTNMEIEARVGGTAPDGRRRMFGKGQVYKLLETQRAEVRVRIETLRADKAQLRCA
jgi:hypothetical protein